MPLYTVGIPDHSRASAEDLARWGNRHLFHMQIADQHEIGGIFTFYEYKAYRTTSVEDWRTLLLQYPSAVIECGSVSIGQAAFFEKARDALRRAKPMPRYKRVANNMLFRYDAAGYQFHKRQEEV